MTATPDTTNPPPLMTEFLLLPDGRVLVQNLTPVMAGVLLDLNPHEEAILCRVATPSRPIETP